MNTETKSALQKRLLIGIIRGDGPLGTEWMTLRQAREKYTTGELPVPDENLYGAIDGMADHDYIRILYRFNGEVGENLSFSIEIQKATDRKDSTLPKIINQIFG